MREVQRSYFHSTDEEESVFEAMLAGSKLGKGIKGGIETLRGKRYYFTTRDDHFFHTDASTSYTYTHA